MGRNHIATPKRHLLVQKHILRTQVVKISFSTAHAFTQSPKILFFYGLDTSRKVLLSAGASAPPSNTWFFGSTRLSLPNDISIGSAIFAWLTAQHPYTLQWAAPFTQNCPFRQRIWVPHLIHGSLSPPQPTTQTPSRSVQPFL